MDNRNASQVPPQPIYRKNYRQPDYWIRTVDLAFELGDKVTTVRSRLTLQNNAAVNSGGRPLVLNGERLKLKSIQLDGRPLEKSEYRVESELLFISSVPTGEFVLETVVEIKPQENTELTGLYQSSGNFCTQCEAEGFRRITYFLDRPDVMAKFTTTITADKTKYPVLLSNGNRVATGELDGNKHWVRWEDPFLKPCYLFALVAGNLLCHAGEFTTRSGRTVRLEILVEPQNIDKCEHALKSLQRSMAWDEQTFGLEYDLDIYMIVAVNDFNMGAMENKGLNVFNSKFVLCSPETATDDDYEAIESVIGHEYFHNWTGNRVTCRDWFQLTLKEGLTVYRDQCFTADMTSAMVKRIKDVKLLRTSQFAEDQGPMAHPIRPESYIEMNNFYTSTVYNKGAEVIRLYEMLLGKDGFRRGMDLYFQRHDGQAVTCDDFRAAMADANHVDLSQFERWYLQAGTPLITAHGEYSAEQRSYILTLNQQIPNVAGQTNPAPQHIPVVMGLVGENGQDLPLQLAGETAAVGTTRTLELRQNQQQFHFINVDSRPIPSLFRGFSAPIRLKTSQSREDLAFLMAHDSDGFNRWEAGQTLAQQLLLDLANDWASGRELKLDPLFIQSFGKLVEDKQLDSALKAFALNLPDEQVLGQQLELIDVDALHEARDFVIRMLARLFRKQLLDIYQEHHSTASYSNDAKAINSRRLKNTVLQYLVALNEPEINTLIFEQFNTANNMTDQFAALLCLVETESKEKELALQAFYERWHHDPLVLDKWFAAQAASSSPKTLDRVIRLTKHADFTLKNPNRLRALIATFSMRNQVRFHSNNGGGYRLLADIVLELDQINPQVASRMVSAFNQWRRFDKMRRNLMEAQLNAIVSHPKLSKDVYEIVSKSLAG